MSTNKASWEEEFDDKFHCGQAGCNCADGIGSIENIKLFIRDLLDQKIAEERKRIEEALDMAESMTHILGMSGEKTEAVYMVTGEIRKVIHEKQ